jgi:glycosyltransferase involved in cell wall biosynthesis
MLMQRGINKSEYEIIGLDAGSKDISKQIYQEFINGFIDVTGLNQSQALNVALKNVKGKYVSWINADDYHLPNYVETLMPAFDALGPKQVSLVCSDFQWIREVIFFPFKMKAFFPFKTRDRFLRKRMHRCSRNIEDLKKSNFVGHASTMISRKHLLQIGGWDESLTYALDYDMWCKLAQVGLVVYVPKITAIMRRHYSSMGVVKYQEEQAESQKVSERHKNAVFKGMHVIE